MVHNVLRNITHDTGAKEYVMYFARASAATQLTLTLKALEGQLHHC